MAIPAHSIKKRRTSLLLLAFSTRLVGCGDPDPMQKYTAHQIFLQPLEILLRIVNTADPYPAQNHCISRPRPMSKSESVCIMCEAIYQVWEYCLDFNRKKQSESISNCRSSIQMLEDLHHARRSCHATRVLNLCTVAESIRHVFCFLWVLHSVVKEEHLSLAHVGHLKQVRIASLVTPAHSETKRATPTSNEASNPHLKRSEQLQPRTEAINPHLKRSEQPPPQKK